MANVDFEDVTRYDVRGDLLKKVIIRIDYTGVPTITDWIDYLTKDEYLSSKFNSYDKGALNKATLRFSNFDEIAKSLSIPLQELKKETIHRFSASKFPGHEDEIVMDVTSYFTTLTIDCHNYRTIDDYFDYINTYMLKLKECARFLKIIRIGIRKIGGNAFPSVDKIGEVFNSQLFFGEIIDETSTTAHEIDYRDSFIEKEDNIKVNYGRLCREVLNQEHKTVYQVLMDIDGYVDEEIIFKSTLPLPDALLDTMKKINNSLFRLFKKSVNQDFLKKCLIYDK